MLQVELRWPQSLQEQEQQQDPSLSSRARLWVAPGTGTARLLHKGNALGINSCLAKGYRQIQQVKFHIPPAGLNSNACSWNGARRDEFSPEDVAAAGEARK